MTTAKIGVGPSDPEFRPPDMSFLQCTRVTMCTVTCPGYDGRTITIGPDVPDPKLRLDGKDSASVQLDADGTGTFELRYNYGTSGPRPDVPITLDAIDDTGNGIPDGSVTYVIGIRRAGAPIVASGNDFAVRGQPVNADGSMEFTYSTWDGMSHLSGGVTVRVSSSRANVRFYAADGTDVTKEDGPATTSAEYTTIPAASGLVSVVGKALGRAALKTVGIAEVNVTVPLSAADVPFQVVTVDPYICTGDLPSLTTSFGSTLNLAGAATTHVALRENPPTVKSDATVVLLINGRPVGPYELTMGSLVANGYELPKIAFTETTIDGHQPGGEALLSYLVESKSSNLNEIMGRGVRFSIKNINYISNRPDPSVTVRPLPWPLFQESVINLSVVLGQKIKVTIDFSGPAAPPAGWQGVLFLYANGYEKNSTQIDKHTLTSVPFTTAPGIVEIEVPTSALLDFAISPAGDPSNVLMDYYVMDPAAYRTLKESAGPEGIDEVRLVSARRYSQYYSRGWPLVTTL